MRSSSKWYNTAAAFLIAALPWSIAKADYRLEPIAGGLDVPWGMVQLPDGDLLVSERDGRLIRLADAGTGERSRISGVPEVDGDGQGGLLDLALHPDFETNRLVYFSYARPQLWGSQTAVGRARLSGDALVDVETVFAPGQGSRGGRHFGSRIAFDRDNFLFVTVGDRGDRDDNPQDLSRVAGKVHRLHDDGRVPEDNPFAGRTDAEPSVWSYGHRNPQGLVIDARSGAVLLHEHGPRGGDELNRVLPGNNYGWPLVTHGINYYGTEITPHTELDGMVSPLLHWTPSIAPSGLTIVRDPALPNINGDLLVGSLKFSEIHRVRLNAARDAVIDQQVLLDTPGRVRNIYSGNHGEVFVAITGAGLFRLVAD